MTISRPALQSTCSVAFRECVCEGDYTFGTDLIDRPLCEVDTPALVIDADAMEANIRDMAEYFSNAPAGLRPHAKTHKSPIVAQAVLARGVTWLATTIAASLVFLARAISRTWLDMPLGFAAGVMIAVGVFWLLIPANNLSDGSQFPVWMVAAAGLLIGSGFLPLR